MTIWVKYGKPIHSEWNMQYAVNSLCFNYTIQNGSHIISITETREVIAYDSPTAIKDGVLSYRAIIIQQMLIYPRMPSRRDDLLRSIFIHIKCSHKVPLALYIETMNIYN